MRQISSFINKFKSEFNIDNILPNPKEWIVVNALLDIKFPISSDIKNIWVISDGESHYGFGELFTSKLGDFDGKIFFSGNYYSNRKIITHKNYEIHLHPLGYQPFSTFDYSYQFEALFYGKKKENHILFDPTTTSESYIKNKEYLVSFLAFRQDLYRDYLYTKLAEMDLVRNTAYHSWNKNEDKLTFSEIDDWKGLGIDESYDYYKSIQFSLPKKLDFNEFQNFKIFENSIQTISKSMFNIVFETQTDFENKKLLDTYEFISLTEKSCFPFWSKSIPLFIHDDTELLAKYFTKIGFDLFTDILGDDFYKNKPIIEQIKNILDFIKDVDSSHNVVDLNNRFDKRLSQNKQLAASIAKQNGKVLRIDMKGVINTKPSLI